MTVDVQIPIAGSRAAVWSAITDIENSAIFISGIEKIEILERPAAGLVGLKWRETRKLFGQSASADKTITEAAEKEFYRTRAEDEKCVYLSTMRITDTGGGVTLSSSHVSEPKTTVARIMLGVMGPLLKGVARKALMQDMNDIKAAVERR